MDREEAIFYIKELQKTYASMDKKVAEAVDMAIEALSADTIDVNDVTIHYKPYPSEKIVYCKDCINRGDIFSCPMDDTYTVNDNEFCSYGVKKTDLGIDPDTIRI